MVEYSVPSLWGGDVSNTHGRPLGAENTDYAIVAKLCKCGCNDGVEGVSGSK